MLLTIFQYIPVLEEEAPGHSELCKKSCEDDHAEDDCSEADGDEAVSTFFNFNFTRIYSHINFYQAKNGAYNSFFQKINIPPPKA